MSTLNSPKLGIFVPSSAIGGAEHYIKNILPLVKQAGFQPILILSTKKPVIDFFADLKVECLVADIAWSGGAEDLKIGSIYLQKLSKQYRSTMAVLESLKLDCAFINLPWVDFGVGISLACHDLKIPSINLVHLCPWKVKLNDLTKQIFQELVAANSRFYTVSNDNRIQLSLSTGIDRDLIEVFYNSRDVKSEYIGLTSKEYKLHRLELLEELELPLNSFLSISVGRFSHQKNFLDILTSFSLIEDKLPNYYHLFLGEGELKQYYQAIAIELDISHKIKFLGYRKDVNRFLALSDLFISTSLYEGLALSILEAAQFSCPIIATDSSSAREIIPDADYGLLYNPGQYNLLARYIEYAYLNYRQMKQKARKLKQLCQSKFSLGKFEQQLNNILRTTIANPIDVSKKLSITYNSHKRMLEVNPNFDTVNYQCYGLPKAIVKPEDTLDFPLNNGDCQLLKQEHERFLHCLYKVSKKFIGQKVILCFNKFDSNFFRSYYSQEHYLLITIAVKESEYTSVAVHYINHTYWGQDIEPECLVKFITFDTNAASIESKARNGNSSDLRTVKHLLAKYARLTDSERLNNLSINLKAIDTLFQPTEYYLLNKDSALNKPVLSLLHS